MEAISPSSHHSPGQPDMATSHEATVDEDSQESMTLQKALAPLPDTQNNSSEHALSSPTERDGGVQLLSRPQNLDIDPGESFSWGKPVKITPGQFSRPAPQRSILDAVKDNASTTSPVGIGNPDGEGPDVVASGSGHSLPIAPRLFGHIVSPNLRRPPVEQSSHVPLVSATGSTGPEENNRPLASDAGQLPRVQSSPRPPPFADYVPQYRRSDAEEKASVAQASVRRSSHPDDLGTAKKQNNGTPQRKIQAPHPSNVCSGQGSRSHHSATQRPQQDQPAGCFQGNEPRYRISLPNDTSVSPAQTAQQLPGEITQNRVLREGLAERKASGKSPYLSLTRPMRDIRQVSKVNTPTSRVSSRSSMHGSNISKKRSRPRPTASSGLHPSRQRNSRHHDDTPTLRRRDRQSAASRPGLSLEKAEHSDESCAIDMVAGNLAQALNNNFGMMRDEWKRKDQDIAYLEHNLRKQEEKLSNFKRQSEGKSGRIQELEGDRTRLHERLESANQQLEDRSAKLSELQKKCRTYKEHLNSATVEQQELYKAAKAKCETAIQQMREEEHKRKLLDEQHRKDLQATRERLSQMVKSTVAEYSSKEREFNDKLESLQERIQEREADVERERETIRSLLEQSATVESLQGTMETFGAQIAQINDKLGDIASGQVNQDGVGVEETQVKLDKIVEHLSALDQRVEPQASIIEKIQEANAQTFSNFLSPVLKSNTEIQSNLDKLADAVEDYMEEFWIKLEDREDVLTDLMDKTKAENAQLQADVQLREDECNVVSYRLEKAEATIQDSEKELENLRNDIAELERAQANDMEQAARANLLHEACEKLKVDVTTKAAVARDLEVRLQHCQAALQSEKEQHKAHSQELQQLIEQREEAARIAQEAAIEVARQEITHDMGIAKEKISMRLKKAEEDSTALKKELDEARQQVSMVQETNKRADTTVNQLRSELKTAQANASRLGDKVNEKDMEIQKAIDHTSTQVTDLEAKVAEKERELAQLSEDAQTYDKRVQKALDSLKGWTRSHKAVEGFFSELRKAQGGNLDGVEPKLKAVLEIDMLHQAIFQYCQAQERLVPNGDGGRTADEPIANEDVGVDVLPGSPPGQVPPKSLAARVLDQVARRVKIMSPSHGAPSPNPPSVLAEQEHRRSANPPRSIMKVGTQSSINEDEDVSEQGATTQSHSPPSRGSFGLRTFKRLRVARARDGEVREQIVQNDGTFTRSDFTRAPYNRLVSGINPRAEDLLSHAGTRAGREQKNRKHGNPRGVGSPPKQASAGTGETSRRLIQKLSPPEGQVSQDGDFPDPPSAPRKRARKNTGDSISPVRSFYFKQSTSTAGREAKKGHTQHGAEDVVSGRRRASLPPKDTSQDAELLDYPRHHASQQNEDSQDSITYSQRERSEPAAPIHRANRLPWYYKSL